MKKFIIGLAIMVATAGLTYLWVNEYQQVKMDEVNTQLERIKSNSTSSKYLVKSSTKAIEKTQEIKESTPYSDEYDFFTYEISEVSEDEYYGIGLDIDNGIVLVKEWHNVELQEGDIITAVFEKGSQEYLLDIQKLVLENGEYIAQNPYK